MLTVTIFIKLPIANKYERGAGASVYDKDDGDGNSFEQAPRFGGGMPRYAKRPKKKGGDEQNMLFFVDGFFFSRCCDITHTQTQ